MVQELEIFDEENLKWALDSKSFYLVDDEDYFLELFESDENKFWEVSEVRPMIKIKSKL